MWWSQRENSQRMGENEGLTGKGVLLGSKGGDEGILLFLGWARWESDHGRRNNLGKGFSTNEGEVLLHGELRCGGHREI